MIEEMTEMGLEVKSKLSVLIIYKGKELSNQLKLDFLVNDIIIVELKAVEQMISLYQAQLLTYLKLTGKPKELLINFNCKNIAKQLVPMVTEIFAKLSVE